MPVAGLRGTGDWGTDERPKNFRESILWMNPNGDTPLLGLTSKVNKKYTTDDPEFSWWAEPQDIIRLQVAAQVGNTVADTLVTVDSPDPDSTNIKRNYGTAGHLVPGDILMVEPSADSATDNFERLIVTQVHSDTAFSVARAQFGTAVAQIANDAYLLHIGNVFPEGSGAPRSATRNPIKQSNLTQIFKTAYEVTGTAAETKTRTGDPIKNDKKRKSFDHAKAIEMAMLWGIKSESIDPVTGKPRRTMGGLRSFIPAANTKILAASWGLAKSASAGNNLMDAISPVFDYNSPAGDTRIGLIGNGALNALNKAILSGSGAAGVKIDFADEKKYWGMNFRELVFPQGRVMVKTHPLLSRHPLFTNSMWILDFSVIEYVAMRGRDTKAKDNIQLDEEDLQRGMWQTECSLRVDMAGQTLGYIGGFGNDPA